MKQKIFLISLIIVVLSFIACGKSEKTDYTVTAVTTPFYFERHSYEGDKPLCKLNEKLMIPLAALEIENPVIDEKVKLETGYNYDDYIFIEEYNAWYIEYNLLEDNEEYSCYLYEDEYEKQIAIQKNKYHFDYFWTEGRVITHALGKINGFDYTNSLEAFLSNYEMGSNVFEVDFCLNNYGELLCLHDYGKFAEFFGDEVAEEKLPEDYTKNEFKELRIYGEYTPLTIDDIIELMQEYKDIYIVTDTKSNSYETIDLEFNDIVNAANQAGCTEVLDRIIPQIHNPEMFYQIMDIYPWKSIIYTSYFLDEEYSESGMFEFSYDNGIDVITLFLSRGTEYYLKECKKYGIKTYVHTYNTEEQRQKMYERGFYGLYTDELLPDYR